MSKTRLGTYKNTVASSDYISYLSCYQANNSTSVFDVSGKGNDLLFNQGRSNLSIAEAWGVSNTLSTVYSGASASAKGVFLPASIINSIDFSKGEGIIICCTVLLTTPLASTGFIAQGSSTADTGIRVGVTSTNLLKPSFYSTTEQVYFPDPSAITPGVPTRVLLYFGGINQTLNFACFLNETSNQSAITSTVTTGSISPTSRVEPLFLGMYKISTNNYASVTASFSSIHMIKVQNISNVTYEKLKDIAVRYKISPNSVLTQDETL